MVNRKGLGGLAVTLLSLGAIARLHNAWASPVMAGYDSFGHFTYIWFLSETGRVPMATHGWSFFHPPLYYALMATFWKAMASFDPVLRLKAGKVLVAGLGLLPAWVAWLAAKWSFPASPRARLLAAALPLLVPVQLYSAGFLGNEALQAVLSALSIAALLRVLRLPTNGRAALLGFGLGLTMLAKFTGIVVVVGAMVTILLKGLVKKRFAGYASAFVVATSTMLLVCGWYYARNILAYGSPFPLSRGTFLVAYVEGNQPTADRGWVDYLTFDPLIFRRPVWPRGQSALEDGTPHTIERSLRESVWTGLYANTWFEGFGGWVLPLVTESEAARRAGQALLTLGLLPTGLMLFGAWSAVTGLRRRGWDDTVMAFATISAAMLVVFITGTRAAPIAAAVKATYLTPIMVCLAFWLANGAMVLERKRPRWTTSIDVLLALQGMLALAVFWQGFLFDSTRLGYRMPHFSDATTTQYGVMEYAGGNIAEARRAFTQASASNYHLAWENLGFLAIDEGHRREGLRLLRLAATLQPEQVDGGPIGREHFLELALAEYDHSIAVVQYDLGRTRQARASWERAIARDPEHTEARWCLAVSRLEQGLRRASGAAERRLVLEEAARELETVRDFDPGFEPGWELSATIESMRDDEESLARIAASWRARPSWVERRFPAETGTGAGLSASIGRRRLIQPRMPELRGDRALRSVQGG